MRTLTISDPALLAPRGVDPDAYKNKVIADGATAYWPLGGGTTDPDLSGNARDLTWTGTTPTAAKILPTFAGGMTVAGSSQSSRGSEPWMGAIATIEAWVKFTSTADMAIVSRRNASEHFAFYHDNTNGLRLLAAYTAGLSTNVVNTGVKVNDGALHHVMYAWSGITWDLWVDGVAYSGSFANLYSQSNAGDVIRVGSETGGRSWNGGLGHVAVYPTRLTITAAATHNTLGRT